MVSCPAFLIVAGIANVAAAYKVGAVFRSNAVKLVVSQSYKNIGAVWNYFFKKCPVFTVIIFWKAFCDKAYVQKGYEKDYKYV